VYDAVVLSAGDVSAPLIRIFAFVFGALWGSFFNVAIYRWPRGMSVISPPSHCPSCGAPVRWYLNVPIVGYALLRGRARCCGAPLTARYVWVELLTAVLFMAVAERFLVGAPERDFQEALLECALFWVFVGGLIIATFVDFEWMEIPDEVSIAGTALGLATVGFREAPGPTAAAVGAGLGYLCIQVPFVWVYEQVRGMRGMGEGDSKLLMMIGAFLGWHGVLFCLLAASVQGLLVAGIGMATGVPLVPRRPDDLDANDASPDASPQSIPTANGEALEDASELAGEEQAPNAGPPMMVFGPMLALSALEYLFFGTQIHALLSSPNLLF
jgi:leader peptidase (prepilin peptidase)/N-methyltransferase